MLVAAEGLQRDASWDSISPVSLVVVVVVVVVVATVLQ
jgi:hypothetical protein